MNKNVISRLSNAIRSGHFNYEKYLNGGTYFGTYINTMPLHCSYGQIGYVVNVEHSGKLKWDWERRELKQENEDRLGRYYSY